MSHLLVTNDFPPKAGGIQSYLYELWRRLDPGRFVVLTHDDPSARAFDAAQPFEIVRVPGEQLLPTPSLRRRIDRLAAARGARLVVLDPVLPLGALGPRLALPYALVLHGAEVTVPGRLPGSRRLLGSVLSKADLVIAAGGYPLGEARRAARRFPDSVLVPPGVDAGRFRPLEALERRAARERFGVGEDALVVVSLSRLVPRKGMDVLIEAAARLREDHPNLVVLIGGTGRDTSRLERLIAEHGAPVKLLGFLADEEVPALLGASDLFVMLCRTRWLGLEQEGFGIVFLEAAAAGVAQVAGRSGGADEAVLDGATGLVADRPGDVVVATTLIGQLLDDAALRTRLGAAARERASAAFDYDVLANTLSEALAAQGG